MYEPLQVRWTESAYKDIRKITRFIRKDSPTAALAVATSLYAAGESLNLFPFKGHVGQIEGTRELVVSGMPDILVYQVTETRVQILHIYHGARNWPNQQ